MKKLSLLLCAFLILGGAGCNKKQNPASSSDDVRTMTVTASNSGSVGVDFSMGGTSLPADSDMNIDGGEWFYVTNGTKGYYTGSGNWADVTQAPAAGNFSSDTTTAIQPAGTPLDSSFINKIWVWITKEGNYVKFQITGLEGGIMATPQSDPKYTFKYFIAPLGTTQFK